MSRSVDPGRLTGKLRESWLVADGAPNFPAKDRHDLFSHAQDAAIVASAPPHTWRDRIFIYEDERRGRDGTGVRKTGLAIPDLAPNWSSFIAQRRRPIVRILGNYPITWKTSFADETFGRDPSGTDNAKLEISIPVEQLTVKNIKNVVSDYWRVRLEALAKELALTGNQTFPADKLREKFPAVRRLQLKRQLGGILVRVKPSDGPARKLQIKPASEGLVVWQLGSKTAFSLIRPKPLLDFGQRRVDPPIPPGAVILGRVRRHQIIELPRTTKRANGFYRITELQDDGVTAVPENYMPQEIARRLKLQSSGADNNNADIRREIVLRRKDLAAYFANAPNRKAT